MEKYNGNDNYHNFEYQKHEHRKLNREHLSLLVFCVRVFDIPQYYGNSKCKITTNRLFYCAVDIICYRTHRFYFL